VFTNDNPLNGEDPLGLHQTAVRGSGFVTTPLPPNFIVKGESGTSYSDGNFRKVSKFEIDEWDLKPHEIKIEIYGRNPSKYDIYINKDTGEIMTGPKNPGPNTEMEPTGYRVVNGKIGEGFKFDTGGVGEEGGGFE
jgi:hypothetical protein